jgi:hypothetical protein
MNVLFAYKHPQADNPAACHVGMGVTAMNTAMALREDRLPADARPVANGEYLWAKLNAPSDWPAYTHVVLCAPYLDAAFLGKLVNAFPMVQFALVYHSNLGFLAVDQFAARSLTEFMEIERRSRNFRVAANSAELAQAITGSTGRDFLYLPNVYHLPAVTRRLKGQWKPPMPLHVGLFGAARVLKNWLTAAAAVMILQREIGCLVHLHLNSGRDEGAEGARTGLMALLKLNLGVQVVDVPWLSADDFRRYLYGMDLLLQPSFTESFNNVTADGCSCGVPSVVSDSIAWAPDEWKAKADSATDIASVALRVLRDRNAGSKGQKALDEHNRQAMNEWRGWLAVS